MEFRDSFESLINQRDSITKIQKFHYLRASLESSAAQLIKSLEFSADNYDIAWQIVCERFNNKKLLIHNHVKAIFNLKQLQKESYKDLRYLTDNLSKHLTILRQLGEPTDSWSTLIIYIASNKLAQEWQKQQFDSERPTTNDFNEFLKSRADLLETLEHNSQSCTALAEKQDKYKSNSKQNSAKICCPFCKGSHNIFYCAQFLKLTVKDRMSKVKHLKLCINCLRGNHEVNTCRFGNCKICNSKHNSILHDSQQTQKSDAPSDEAITEPTTCAVATGSRAISSTVLIDVLDKHHKKHPARALLDCGSQSSFISKDLADTLNLDKHKTSLCISGISNNLSYSHLKCVVKVFSRCSDFSTKMSCFIIDKITGNLPDFPIHTNNWNIPCNIKLADPTYNKPGKIDILIGADVFWQLLCVGQLNIGSDEPLLQKTRLGWVVAGFNNSESKTSKSSCHLSQIVDIQKTLSQFWEVEEVSSTTKPMSLEEKLCEQHFSENLQLSPTDEVEDKFPDIAKIICTNMYVDDLLTGAKSVDHAQQICSQIYDILNSRGFQLRKWRSNRPETIQQFSDTSESKSLEFSLNKEHEFKTLGLSWNSENDSLNYKIHPNKQTSGKVTKRIILSKIASIFDPLGLLGPCIILAKILLQKLWLEKLTWDESLPYNLHQRWLEFSSQMDSLNSLHIPRKVTCNDAVKFELHAFSGASEQAYGACVFIKSLNARGECSVNLLCAKSKVAPLKTLTMPRLELCAALTLARMVSKISESVEIKFEKIYCWSDSSIVLAWLRTSPSLPKPFVDSRVAEIQKLTESFVWKHVSTKDNPADLLSRGVRPEAIQDCVLWWFGPTWLKSDQDLWPNPQHLVSHLPELRKTLKVLIIDQNVINFERFSSLTRLKRSFAYLLRFIKNSKEPKPERHLGHLSTSEINDAFHSLIRISQLLSFPSDYQRLKEGNNLSSSSRILSLSPFMDRDGLIRVGGRLKNSNLPYCRKHPILLNSSHHLTKLIIRKAHLDLLHAGTEQVLSHVRETFWPISGRSVARQVVKKCVTCAKFSTKIVQPVMGNLPASRVTPDFPFSKVGVDYCGPFLIKGKRGRGSTSSKCWIALFVCFVTRAIHLELVTSLTTEAFMQTLKRFMGRRGKPNDLYSDNGTNFVGASREIGRFLKGNNAAISEGASNLNIRGILYLQIALTLVVYGKLTSKVQSFIYEK
nr:unnamed protein product [Callosobruchus analis]